MGLVLLSLLVAGASATGFGDGPYTSSAVTAGPGSGDDHLSSLPPQTASLREHHVLSLWPPPRSERSDEVAHLTLPPTPGHGSDAVRDPQRFAYGTAGSRSPPLI